MFSRWIWRAEERSIHFNELPSFPATLQQCQRPRRESLCSSLVVRPLQPGRLLQNTVPGDDGHHEQGSCQCFVQLFCWIIICLLGKLKFAGVLSICYREELRVEGVKPGTRATRILVLCEDLQMTYHTTLMPLWLHVSGISHEADFSKIRNYSKPGKCWKSRKLLRMRKSKD